MASTLSASLVALCFAASAALSTAAPGPLLNVRDLVQKSDVVAMGRITSVSDAGPATIQTSNGSIEARAMIGEMDVDHVLKGPAEMQAVRFRFSLPEVGMGYRGVPTNGYRVVFLKSSVDAYEFTSPYHPSVIASPAGRITADEPMDRVCEAVAAVLHSPTPSLAEKREAINALWGVPNTAAVEGLRDALRERDQNIQLNAAAALLAANDLAGLSIAVQALLTPDQIPADLRLNLRGAIARGVTSQNAVPGLSRLLSSKEPETRRSAVTALGRTKSVSALVQLGRALDDEDFSVRLASVRALAEATGHTEMTASEEAFRSDELRFVKYWKEHLSGR